jgi:hypothetical protein
MSHQLQGLRAGLINKVFDQNFLDFALPIPQEYQQSGRLGSDENKR